MMYPDSSNCLFAKNYQHLELQSQIMVLRQLTKGPLSKVTVAKGTYVHWHCPCRLFSKEIFVHGRFYRYKTRSNCFFSLSIETYHTSVPWTKITDDKSLLGQLCPRTIIPWTIFATPKSYIRTMILITYKKGGLASDLSRCW